VLTCHSTFARAFQLQLTLAGACLTCEINLKEARGEQGTGYVARDRLGTTFQVQPSHGAILHLRLCAFSQTCHHCKTAALAPFRKHHQEKQLSLIFSPGFDHFYSLLPKSISDSLGLCPPFFLDSVQHHCLLLSHSWAFACFGGPG